MFEKFNDEMITRKVPKFVKDRTRENMEVYNMDLYDAFKEAARAYGNKSGKSKKLFAAWYYDDYREFIPSAYEEKYLDFEAFPLRYSA